MTYLAKNIREGYTVKEATERALNSCYKPPFFVEIDSFDSGRDICGNGTAHYICRLYDSEDKEIIRIVESGKRREQVGYSGANGAALYALYKLGFEVDTSKKGSYDCQTNVSYPLINFPSK